MIADWRDITDEKEKYAAYLCSREWSEKRELVRERSGGRCERCEVYPMDAVHHLTYARKYAERLDDLQAICDACHKFTHGKSDRDPRLGADSELKVYLAGKVPHCQTDRDWRHEYLLPRFGEDVNQWLGRHPLVEYGRLMFTESVLRPWKVEYVGPYYADDTGGHGTMDYKGKHASGPASATKRRNVYDQCVTGICESTHVIAWVDHLNQFGTIFELGYALAQGKKRMIGIDSSRVGSLGDHWFYLENAKNVYVADDPVRFIEWAVKSLLAQLEGDTLPSPFPRYMPGMRRSNARKHLPAWALQDGSF